MKIASIDLGSNTFHLLIGDMAVAGTIQEIYRERVFVGLCEDGIDHISEVAIGKALAACTSFAAALDQFEVDKVGITATAALRSAANSNAFIIAAQNIFGRNIEIIDGLREAAYIFKGVGLLSKMEERTLIVDIGGGSTELIIVEKNEMIWAGSYQLGVGVLDASFPAVLALEQEQLDALRRVIHVQLGDFKNEVAKAGIKSIIGAAGSFEVFESMSGMKSHRHKVNQLEIGRVKEIISAIIKLGYEERCKLEGMPIERAKLIVVGMVLIGEIIEMVEPERLYVTPYALKEGRMVEMSFE